MANTRQTNLRMKIQSGNTRQNLHVNHVVTKRYEKPPFKHIHTLMPLLEKPRRWIKLCGWTSFPPSETFPVSPKAQSVGRPTGDTDSLQFIYTPPKAGQRTRSVIGNVISEKESSHINTPAQDEAQTTGNENAAVGKVNPRMAATWKETSCTGGRSGPHGSIPSHPVLLCCGRCCGPCSAGVRTHINCLSREDTA